MLKNTLLRYSLVVPQRTFSCGPQAQMVQCFKGTGKNIPCGDVLAAVLLSTCNMPSGRLSAPPGLLNRWGKAWRKGGRGGWKYSQLYPPFDRHSTIIYSVHPMTTCRACHSHSNAHDFALVGMQSLKLGMLKNVASQTVVVVPWSYVCNVVPLIHAVLSH